MDKKRIKNELKFLFKDVGEKFNEIKLRDLKEDEMYKFTLCVPANPVFRMERYTYFSDNQEFDINNIEFKKDTSKGCVIDKPGAAVYSVINSIDFINEDNVIVKTIADGFNNIIEREVRFQDQLVFVEKLEYDELKRPIVRWKYYEDGKRFDRYLFNYDEKTMIEIIDSKLKSMTFYKDNSLDVPDFGVEYDDNEEVIEKQIRRSISNRFYISIVKKEEEINE